MWLLFSLCFGLLVSVQGNNPFRELDRLIPKTDPCFIGLIMCDNYKLPLTPVEKTHYEFYTETSSLNTFCSENKYFMECIKNAIEVCKEVPHPSTTEELIETRVFAEGFCSTGSLWQKLYLENAACINSFAPAVEDVCGYKAIDLLREARTTKLNEMCLSSIAMRECFVRMISKMCGFVAAAVVKRVVMYSVGDDFICNRLEEHNEGILQKLWISPARSYALKSDQTLLLFQSDGKVPLKLAKPIEVPPTEVYSTIQLERITSRTPTTTGMPNFASYLEDKKDFSTTLNLKDTNIKTESYFTEMSPSEMDKDKFFDEYSTTPIPTTITSNVAYLEHTSFPSEETYSFTNLASFGLYEMLDSGDSLYLGCGTATVQWTIDQIPTNVFCGWVTVGATNKFFKCTIHLGEACIFKEYDDSTKKEINMASRKIMLVVINVEKGSYQEVATMKMRYFRPDENVFTLVADMVDDKL
ncbi:hypothetical protein TNCT_706651 [Trichonephila clavata]|uniref:DUF19 domain-containing protein n=1 Tax=Trichonephila clavata TaxID=2740835 RepID=A0A8X6LIH6_TRICU|nr:hypothetical protein TNCT_706651 [Trichonephila clavata]